MKYFLLLFWMLAFLKINAQHDTITLNSGRTLVGSGELFYNDRIIFIDTAQKEYMVMTRDVSTARIKYDVGMYGDNSAGYKMAYSIEELKKHVSTPDWKGPEVHLDKAGNFGIAAVVVGLGGIALSAVGAATGKPPLAYAGAGVGGIGFCLLIPTFIHIKQAGRVSGNYQIP